MRKIKFILISFTVAIQLSGQTHPVRIDLNDVDLAENPLRSESYKSVIEKRVMYEIESYDYSKASDSLVYSNLHPMVAALHYSFADHRPVILSPDMIWLLITQSFAIHINQNPEKYRDQIVGFKDKKTIQVTRNDFRKGLLTNPWHETFSVFSDSIKKYIGESLHQTLIPNFSTTGIAEKAAFEISLMNATSSYFDYEYITICGIPYIILQGEPSDWKWIADHLDTFNSFGLEFWTSKIKPIVEEIYQSSLGNHNIDFWKNIYKWHQKSGGNLVSGWITNFFLYTKEPDQYRFNHLLFRNQDSLSAQSDELYLEPPGLQGNEFSSGLSKADFTWYHLTEPVDTFRMCFYAGFMGIVQDVKTLELMPEISYAVVDKNSRKLYSDYFIETENYNTLCNSHLYHARGVNQLPIFHPDTNNFNSIKSEESFKKYIKQQVAEKYPSGKIDKYFTISFLVTKTGDIKDVTIETSSQDEIVIDFIKKVVYETKDWKPAIINGEKEDYKLTIGFRI